MSSYQTPGVYREDVFPEPPPVLRTGVPALLGYARGKFLFRVSPAFQSELDGKIISEGLRQEFKNNQFPLSQAATVCFTEQEPVRRWLITDQDNQPAYSIRQEEEGSKLNVHAWAIGMPHMLTLWPQFENEFGARVGDGYLSYAVHGFFENGGQLCYVVQLDDTISAELALHRGLEAIAPLETIDLVCVPDLAGLAEPEEVYRLQRRVLEFCDRLGDRFAILDSQGDDDLEKIKERPNELRQGGVSGTNGALYFPWIGLGALDETGQRTIRYVPPCGHVAGIYAACDERVGVHKAPANEELAGVLDLPFNLTDAQQADLNPAGVNCLRAFPGRGIRVWGARTLSTDPAWTYVNVRRLFLTAGRWIERAVAGVVFEPNDVRLWVRLERELSAYFSDLFRRGALKGRLEQDAFYVRCNAETNPPEVREAGQVVTEIGLAPALPGEFVVVRLIHGAGGLTITGPSRS